MCPARLAPFPRLPTWAAPSLFLFFFNDTATTEISTLSLHDALPILNSTRNRPPLRPMTRNASIALRSAIRLFVRSEEHTSELQSHVNLVCRLLLEKKKNREAPQAANPVTRTANVPRSSRGYTPRTQV